MEDNIKTSANGTSSDEEDEIDRSLFNLQQKGMEKINSGNILNNKISCFSNINSLGEEPDKRAKNAKEKLDKFAAKNLMLSLKPRDYQLKIYEAAKKQNSIIFLETGKGKTFIAIMLIGYYLGIDISKQINLSKVKVKSKKKVLFLVCDTALIDQQQMSISKNLNIKVEKIQGKKNKKSKSDLETFKI